MASSGGGGPNKLASLRAMFEKRDDSNSNSPPDRGRSGVASAASSRNDTSPRPLSKVRTSFIAVGGSGGLGLIRGDSSNSDNTNRRSAFSMDSDTNPKEMADTKETLNEELNARMKTATVNSETIPENVLETPAETPALEPVDKQLGAKSDDKPVNGKPPVSRKPSPTKTAAGGHTLKPAPVLTSRDKSANGTSVKSPRSTGPASAKTATASAKPATKHSTPSSRPKPALAAISTTKSTTTPKASPKPAKSPMPKTPTTPRALTQKKSPVKTTVPAAAPKPSKTTEKQPSRSSLPSDASHKSPHKSPAASQKNHESPHSAFVKPKPRSPTKPVRLPASLMAPTASSRSKTSGTTAPPPVRSQSRAVIAESAGLRRSQSTASKRSAIGPPPTRKDPARPKRAGSADGRPKSAHAHVPAPSEGFMARMMRPTASSQSKTSEKAPTTPPRKSQPAKRPGRQSTSRPSTRDSNSTQKAFEASPRVSKAQKPSSIPPISSEKSKEVAAMTELVEVAPEAGDLTAVAGVVPETAAEAVIITKGPIADVKTPPVLAEEVTKVGEKTECAPTTDEATPTSEEPAATTASEVEEPKQEVTPVVSNGTEAPAEVITDPSTTLENTAEQKADASDVTATETEVEPTVEEKEEETAKSATDVGETF